MRPSTGPQPGPEHRASGLSAALPTTELAEDYRISRIISGGWQFARGHNPLVELDDAAAAIYAAVEGGVTAFDCADIYTGVEELLGTVRPRIVARYGHDIASQLRFHTKFVPDLDALPSITRDYVTGIIDRSLARLCLERLDLVQFHWWDFDQPGYVEAAGYLDELRHAGKIRLLGATNFDVSHLAEIVAAGIPIAAHQVQYSLLDQRAAGPMTSFCERHGIKLLCYGTLAGGFITDRFLGVRDQPDPPQNRSQVKYGLIIDEFGGWPAFQRLLGDVHGVALKHGATVANVAEQYVLSAPQVAAIIVGAHNPAHISENRRSFDVALDADDRRVLEAARARSRWTGGDVYDLEREKGGRHAAVMNYNLNREAPREDPPAPGSEAADQSPEDLVAVCKGLNAAGVVDAFFTFIGIEPRLIDISAGRHAEYMLEQAGLAGGRLRFSVPGLVSRYLAPEAARYGAVERARELLADLEDLYYRAHGQREVFAVTRDEVDLSQLVITATKLGERGGFDLLDGRSELPRSGIGILAEAYALAVAHDMTEIAAVAEGLLPLEARADARRLASDYRSAAQSRENSSLALFANGYL
jgi:aryl-alcohol dehydrogenase-like predicted oxidoreductase